MEKNECTKIKDTLWGKTYDNPQTQLAVLATAIFFLPAVVYISYGHPYIWLILPLALPTLFIYLLAPFLFPAAVITIDCQLDIGDFLLIEGKKYYLESDTRQVKIFFRRNGKHKIFLIHNGKLVKSLPEEINTYEHHIVYVAFLKSLSQQDNVGALQAKQ